MEYLEIINDIPVLPWLVANWFWVWLTIKLLGFIAESTKIKWDNKIVKWLEMLLRYLLPGKAPFMRELDQKEEQEIEKESKSKKVEKEVRKQIRNL